MRVLDPGTLLFTVRLEPACSRNFILIVRLCLLDAILFTVREKTSTLTAQRIPEAPNGTMLPLLANVSVVLPNPLEKTSFAAAEVLISTPTERLPSPHSD